MTVLARTKICDIPISCHFSKIPWEKDAICRESGISADGYDFLFALEDDLGNYLKVWGARFEGDRSWVRWQDDEFDYDLEQEADLLWERK